MPGPVHTAAYEVLQEAGGPVLPPAPDGPPTSAVLQQQPETDHWGEAFVRWCCYLRLNKGCQSFTPHIRYPYPGGRAPLPCRLLLSGRQNIPRKASPQYLEAADLPGVCVGLKSCPAEQVDSCSHKVPGGRAGILQSIDRSTPHPRCCSSGRRTAAGQLPLCETAPFPKLHPARDGTRR